MKHGSTVPFVMQEITIWGMDGEPPFTYTAPPEVPSAGDTGTGLAPPGLFIPEIALNDDALR